LKKENNAVLWKYRNFIGWKVSMKKQVKDHLGNEYPSVKKMCEHYGINEKTYRSRVTRNGYSLEEALGVIPRIGSWTKDLKVDDKFTILKCIESSNIQHGLYFECILDERDVIYTYDEILEYYRENVF